MNIRPMMNYGPYQIHRPLFQATKTCPPTVEKTQSGLIKPPCLKPGDTVAIVSPATPVSEQEMKDAVKYLKKMGFKVVKLASTRLYNRHYLSDTDERRAAAINRAFADPNINGIFVIQGGAGTYRPDFLNQLNWKLIRKNPKIVTGYSDITYLHQALRNKAGIVSFHTCFPKEISMDLQQFANSRDTIAFWKLMMPIDSTLAPDPIVADKRKYRCLSPGVARGEVVGGNLFTLAATLGTPYETDLKGKILLLEDWKLDYESLDAHMSQLINHGMWDKITGLIIGDLVHTPKTKGEYGLKLTDVLKDITTQAQRRGIPVGYRMQIGHGKINMPVTLGIQAQFDSKNGTLIFLESPFSATPKPDAEQTQQWLESHWGVGISKNKISIPLVPPQTKPNSEPEDIKEISI